MGTKTTLVIAGSIAALAPLVLSAAPTAGAAVTARVAVSPSIRLQGGDEVKVWARGLPRSTPVRVVQCDTFGNPDEVCPDAAVVTTSRLGTLAAKIRLRDPLISAEPVGSGRAVYCRADQCRIGLVTLPDAEGQERVLGVSPRLIFKGSPATISARPATDLARYQWIRVRGTAYGAQGRPVRIVEQNCYTLVQETGCYAAAKPVWTKVKSDGTFSARYLSRRVLSEAGSPVDCTDTFNILGTCVMSATVYRRNGTPDDSFGIASFGHPMVPLTFRSAP